MKWITLKMHMIPIIFQEIDFITEQYISLLTSIRKEEQEKEEESSLQESKKKFNTLREEITKRINELEQFYEDNIEDIRVTNFEKARLRLKKLLMYDLDTINKIENSSNQANVFTTTHIQQTSPTKEVRRKEKREQQQETVTKKKKSSSVAKNVTVKREPNAYMKPLDKTKRHRTRDNSTHEEEKKNRIETNNSEAPLK